MARFVACDDHWLDDDNEYPSNTWLDHSHFHMTVMIQDGYVSRRRSLVNYSCGILVQSVTDIALGDSPLYSIVALTQHELRASVDQLDGWLDCIKPYRILIITTVNYIHRDFYFCLALSFVNLLRFLYRFCFVWYSIPNQFIQHLAGSSVILKLLTFCYFFTVINVSKWFWFLKEFGLYRLLDIIYFNFTSYVHESFTVRLSIALYAVYSYIDCRCLFEYNICIQ